MTELIIFTGLVGAAIGSFLNVVIYRVPRGESLVSPGSRCPSCAVAIGPIDNVPVVSWLALHGRCRGCAEPISVRYPLVEALTAVVFVLVAIARGPSEELAVLLPFVALLIAVAGIDYDHRVIPNKLMIAGAGWALLSGALVTPDAMPEALIAGSAAFLALLLTALAYPAGMGMGDVKLAGVMGLFLGYAVVPALFVAFLTGAAVGCVQLARHGIAARKHALPFAPFLALGGLVGVIVGPELIDLYSRSFL